MAALCVVVATMPTTPQGIEAHFTFGLHFTDEWGGDDGELVTYENWNR